MSEMDPIESFVFVAMPFGTARSNEIYEDGICRAIKKLGLTCKRSDEIFDTDIIIKSIENDIRNSLLVIADLTGRNPNVFYEVGFARALGKEVVLLTQSKEDVPFDLRHRRYINYGVSGRELSEMRRAVEKTLNTVIPRARQADADNAALNISKSFEDFEVDSPVPVFHTARLNAMRAACQSNLKQLGLAAMMYIQDSEEKFPPCSGWQEALLPYVRNAELYKCPASPDLEFGYAMNAELNEIHLALLDDPSRTPLFFDSSIGQTNASGVKESLCNPPRHLGRNNIVFADGHVSQVKSDDVASLIWSPKL